MIKSKKKPMYNPTGREMVYYFKSLDEWLTVGDIASLEGCALTQPGIHARIKNINKDSRFNTIEGVAFTPSLSKKKFIRGPHVKESKALSEYVKIMFMFIPREYKPRIIGSR